MVHQLRPDGGRYTPDASSRPWLCCLSGARRAGLPGSFARLAGRSAPCEECAGRLTQQTLSDTRVITTTYDADGNIASITPPGRPAHSFDYTAIDLQSTYTPPTVAGTGATTYAYSLDRQRTAVTRPDSQTLTSAYDTAGRLSTQTLPGNQTITYAYDSATGNIATITAPDALLTFSYDGTLLTSEAWSGTIIGTVSRTYDNDFRVTTQSVNGLQTISFNYDADSLLTAAGAQTIARSTLTGLLTGSALGSVTDAWTYDAFGQAATYTGSYSATTLLSEQYTRDALGRIVEKAETIGGVSTTYAYNYDLAGRLTDVYQGGTVVSHYDYDTNTNRTGGYTPMQGAISGTSYDNQDRLLSYTTANTGTIAYTYTANGELATRTDGNGVTSYTYDVLGNLRSVTLPDLTLIEYLVDGKNRRIGKKVNGSLMQGFLLEDQLRPVAELDGQGNIVSRFVYGDRSNVPEYMVKSGITYRIISDHLGSPRLVVNTADSAIAQRVDYDEFGSVLHDSSPGFQPFGFAGGLYDSDTRLVRFGARDYDPETGRWIVKDATRFRGQDTNLFGYALNDPVNGFDPTGFACFAVGAPTATEYTYSRGTQVSETSGVLSDDGRYCICNDITYDIDAKIVHRIIHHQLMSCSNGCSTTSYVSDSFDEWDEPGSQSPWTVARIVPVPPGLPPGDGCNSVCIQTQ